MKKFKQYTIGELIEQTKPYKYVKIIYNHGMQYAINSRIIEMAKIKHKRTADHVTDIIYWQPITFNEYLNYKNPFL